MTAAIIIIVSWYLNAMMDAIDHGKGNKTLYELWHIIKFVSYALPFGYIISTAHIPAIWLAICAALMCGWYPLYHILRAYNFWMYDDFVKIPWLRWIWGVKR